MCKSLKDGGERCDAHSAVKSLSAEADLRAGVLASMPKSEREYVEAMVTGYDSMLEHSQFVDSDAIIVNEDNDYKIREQVMRNGSWIKAYENKINAEDKSYEYDRATADLDDPSEDTKEAYLERFDKEFRDAGNEISEIYDNNSAEYALPREAQIRVNELNNFRNRKVAEFPEFSAEEAQKIREANPYTAELEKATKEHEEVHQRLTNHYRTDFMTRNNAEFGAGYEKYAETAEGQKKIRALAEVRAGQMVSKKSLDGLKRKVNIAMRRGDNEKITKARKSLLAAERYASASEYTNKYKYLNKQAESGNDVDKEMFLPRQGSGQYLVLPDHKYEALMLQADRAYGQQYADKSPEERRTLVEKDLFERKGALSVKSLNSNPRIKSGMEASQEHNNIIRENMIQAQERKLREHYTAGYREAQDGREELAREYAREAKSGKTIFDYL